MLTPATLAKECFEGLEMDTIDAKSCPCSPAAPTRSTRAPVRTGFVARRVYNGVQMRASCRALSRRSTRGFDCSLECLLLLRMSLHARMVLPTACPTTMTTNNASFATFPDTNNHPFVWHFWLFLPLPKLLVLIEHLLFQQTTRAPQRKQLFTLLLKALCGSSNTTTTFC